MRTQSAATNGGLIVVTAHPDDEVLIAGGTLAACAEMGLPTGVVCLTRGEQGPIADARLATRDTLPEVRAAELQAACRELGVSWVKCYRRQDGNLLWSSRAGIVRQLERILRLRQPDAVVTFGEDGLYYHPDHIAAYEFTRAAVARIPDRPVLYRSVWPEDMMSELAAELQQRGLASDLWDLGADAFGSEEDDSCFAVDVRRFAERKLRALRAHRTQLPSDHAFAVLEGDLVPRFMGIERFGVVARGRNGSGWLEGVLAGV